MPSPVRPPSGSPSSHRASTGHAIRRGEIKISDPIPFTFNTTSTGTTGEALEPQAQRSDATWPRKSAPSALSARRGSSSQAEGVANARASAGPSIVASTMSSAPSRDYVSGKKNNGFRATIKRVFGSKKHRPTASESRNKYHQSDPGNLTINRDTQRDTAVMRSLSPRKLSVPQSLNTHSINAASQVPDLPSPEPAGLIRRRRNTLPSIILSDEEAQALATRLTSLRPSQHAASPSKDDIRHAKQLKRRSRSADALAEMTSQSEAESPDRLDRTGEIAYWRNSVLANPVPSFNPSTYLDTAPLKITKSTVDSNRLPPTRPFDSFDFGLESNTLQPASLDQRVNTLEVKMFDFEYALAKLQGVDLPKPRLPVSTNHRRSIHELFPTNSCPSSMTSSATNEGTFLSSPGESPITPSDDTNYIGPDRGSKATTIKPEGKPNRSGRSHTPSPSSIHMTPSQFETLLALIRDEKAARQQMEMQIMDLQKEVEFLRSPVFATIRPSNNPTQGPESPRSKPLHRSPRFEFQKQANAQEMSRFSMTESDLETDTDEGFQDVYATPQENRFTFDTPRAAPLVGMI